MWKVLRPQLLVNVLDLVWQLLGLCCICRVVILDPWCPKLLSGLQVSYLVVFSGLQWIAQVSNNHQDSTSHNRWMATASSG